MFGKTGRLIWPKQRLWQKQAATCPCRTLHSTLKHVDLEIEKIPIPKWRFWCCCQPKDGNYKVTPFACLVSKTPSVPPRERLDLNLNIKDELGVKADLCVAKWCSMQCCLWKSSTSRKSLFYWQGNCAGFYYGVGYSLKASSQTQEGEHVFLSI